MDVVTRFEADLLRHLHAVLRPGTALPRRSARPAPTCLTRPALALIQDSLARGVPLLLARLGGWRRDRHVASDGVVEGRLWERTPAAGLGLSYTVESLRFLVWLTTVDRKKPQAPSWSPPADLMADGDEVLLALAYGAAREADLGLSRKPAFAGNALCRLAYVDDFTAEAGGAMPDFAPWTTGPRSCVLEAFQRPLAARWVEIERAKGELTDPNRMRALGMAQERTLKAFLAATEAAGRTDLARWLLQAAARLLPQGVAAAEWVAALEPPPGQRLAERMKTRRTAGAMLRSLDTLKAWERQARRTGYFDDGYAAAQLYLSDWEAVCGDEWHARALGVVRELEPM